MIVSNQNAISFSIINLHSLWQKFPYFFYEFKNNLYFRKKNDENVNIAYRRKYLRRG